jgi:hypothetical protein
MGKLFWLLFFIAALIVFNLSYLGNSGLLIFNLKTAKRIGSDNVRNEEGNSLAKFTMEEFMSEKDAAVIVNRISQLPLQRRNLAMSTYGTASYLDGSNLNVYRDLAAITNPSMRKNFGDLMDHVLRFFRARTSSKVEYHEPSALPGFHVFDSNRVFSYPVASVHKDMQFLRIGLDEYDSKNSMSFTIALEVPEGGSGLYIFENAEANIFVPRPIVYNLADKKYIEYRTGWIVTHGGQKYHMIAPSKEGQGRRITLQGHGVYVKSKDTWMIYW